MGECFLVPTKGRKTVVIVVVVDSSRIVGSSFHKTLCKQLIRYVFKFCKICFR